MPAEIGPVRMEAEKLGQQRQLSTPQAQGPALAPTLRLPQQPSAAHVMEPAGRVPTHAEPVVFNPRSLATLTLEADVGEPIVVTVKNPFTVGRNKSNDLVIRDLHVSSQHARFAARTDGVFEVVDLDSSGGTFVNDERIERHALRSGDQIRFATITATFRYVAGDMLAPEDEIDGTLVQSKGEAARRLAAVSQAPRHGLLTVLTAHEQSRTVPAGGQITIGRSSASDLLIAEEHVSGRHARLAGDGTGGFELFDLGSSCGTFINGIQIQHQALQNGDRIRFGIVDCVFLIIDPAGGAAPPVKNPALQGTDLSLPRADASGLSDLPRPKPATRPGNGLPDLSRP